MNYTRTVRTTQVAGSKSDENLTQTAVKMRLRIYDYHVMVTIHAPASHAYIPHACSKLYQSTVDMHDSFH